jgi:hypothetical protein
MAGSFRVIPHSAGVQLCDMVSHIIPLVKKKRRVTPGGGGPDCLFHGLLKQSGREWASQKRFYFDFFSQIFYKPL